MKSLLIIVISIVGIIFINPTSSISITEYTLTDLGTFMGNSIRVKSINNFGQIAGYTYIGPEQYAILWDQGQITELGNLGNKYCSAQSINNFTQIVGVCSTESGSRAFLWENGSIMNLGTLGGNGSAARSINYSGQIVGESSASTGGPVHGFLWENNGIDDLGGWESYAHDINNLKQIVGAYKPFHPGPTHACLWENGKITDLGHLGEDFSVAWGLNDVGQIVATSGGGSQVRSFLWENGIKTEIPPIGNGIWARAINIHGLVVGHSTFNLNLSRAFVYEDGTTYDLNKLVKNTNDYYLEVAYDINDNGQIIGHGSIDLNRDGTFDEFRSFLLTPIHSSITVNSPNGGEILSAGSPHDITWLSDGNIEYVRIEYSTNNGADWMEIIANTENNGVYSWEVPCNISDECLVRVSDANNGISDTSDDFFSIIDDIPPTIEVSVTPDMLWPPNHKMVAVNATVIATDNCDSEPMVELVSISMNESDSLITYDPNFDYSLVDGKTSGDIQVIDDWNFYLRSERSGKSDGRLYTITYKVTDASGNESTAAATVLVPHNM